MAIKTFKLKSGANLEIGDIGFEAGVSLMEVVGHAVASADPESQFDVILFNPEVRKAIYACLPWLIYNKVGMDVAFLSSPSFHQADWFELAGRVVEVGRERFFHKASSGSSIPGEAAIKSPVLR